MVPVVFTIPFIGMKVPGYGLMLTVAFLLAIVWAARRAARSGGNPDVIFNAGFVALVCGVVGCRGMYVVHYWDQFAYRGSLAQILWAIIDVRNGGLEFYGGFILSVIGVPLWLTLVEKVSLRWYMDIVAPSAALGLAIGRVGCFLNGCCYGNVSDLPWATRFPFGSNAQIEHWQHKLPGAELPRELISMHAGGVGAPLGRTMFDVRPEELDKATAKLRDLREKRDELDRKLAAASQPTQREPLQNQKDLLNIQEARLLLKYGMAPLNMLKYGLSGSEIHALAKPHESLGVHPTQLYSTATALLVAGFLNALYYRRTRDGQVICTLLLIEPVTRWILEVIRADNPTDTLGTLTISQFLALCMTLLGLFGLILLQRMPPRSPRAREWTPEPDEAAAKPSAA
jgi:phosphatidylglycerol:prolipoprotein diacylglycerol transferase